MTERAQHLLRGPRPPIKDASLDRTHDAVVVVDDSLRIVSWNRGATRLYGVACDQAIGRAFTEHVTCHPSRAAADVRSRGRRRNALEGSGLVDGPGKHVAVRSGREVSVNVCVLPLRRRRGVSLFLAVIRNDARHARLAASLRERLVFEMLLSELSARFSQIPEEEVDAEIDQWLGRLVKALDVDRSSFSHLRPDGSLVVTHAYAVPGLQPAQLGPANRRLPWLVSEFLAGRNVLLSRIPEDLPPDAREEREYFLGVGMKSGIGVPVVVAGAAMCVLTFGAFRKTRSWPAEVIARLYLAGNAFANAVARKVAKQRLEEKQHELVHLGRVAAMGELASVIAHELDQPLTVVVSNAEAIRHSLRSENPDLDDTDDALREISDAAMRASEIVQRERQLLRKSPRRLEPLDLNEVLGEIEMFVRAEGRQFGARVVMELAADLPPVVGDRVQLQQVVFNLTRNALQAMRPQPPEVRTLTITTAQCGGEVTLSVADGGPAVDPLVLRRMFEPFYTTKSTGLGMGLSITKSIVDAHGGRIRADANPGGGLTMTVSFPRK